MNIHFDHRFVSWSDLGSHLLVSALLGFRWDRPKASSWSIVHSDVWWLVLAVNLNLSLCWWPEHLHVTFSCDLRFFSHKMISKGPSHHCSERQPGKLYHLVWPSCGSHSESLLHLSTEEEQVTKCPLNSKGEDSNPTFVWQTLVFRVKPYKYLNFIITFS